MPAREFFAFDNATLTVASTSPSGAPGAAINNANNTAIGTVFSYSGGSPVTVKINDKDGPRGGQREILNDNDISDHVVIDGAGLVADGSGIEGESLIFVRELDADGNPTGPVITITVFSEGGTDTNIWGFGTNTALKAGKDYVVVDKSTNGSTPYADFVPCFAAGTLIRTPGGLCPVEDITAGDRVWTRDDPSAVVTWAGSAEVAAEDAFAPIVFAAGTLGNTRELVLSPEHRVAIDGAQAQLMFGEETVLVAAKHLLGAPGVSKRSGGRITYCHFMFDRHRIVEAEGTPCESFYPGDMALTALDRAARAELLALFPELARGPDSYGPLAAACLKRREAAVLRLG